MKKIFVFLGCLVGFYCIITFNAGCAQISQPTGGARDTLPPRLVKASPELNTVNFEGNRITLTFNEYIEVQELQNNLIISPVQKLSPVITENPKSISIRFKDTLLQNTTYSLNFGNAIKDSHEGNVLKDFTYIFSTGNTIDSLTLEGKIVLAESGKPDSTLMAMLYRNLNDTAVLKLKPVYITRLSGDGHFKFKNLPDANFKIYGLKDGDGGKTYNSKTELFAFNDTTVSSLRSEPVTLYAYVEQKTDDRKLPESKNHLKKS